MASKSKDNKLQVCTRVKPNVKKSLVLLASDEGISISEITENIIEEYLKHRGLKVGMPVFLKEVEAAFTDPIKELTNRFSTLLAASAIDAGSARNMIYLAITNAPEVFGFSKQQASEMRNKARTMSVKALREGNDDLPDILEALDRIETRAQR